MLLSSLIFWLLDMWGEFLDLSSLVVCLILKMWENVRKCEKMWDEIKNFPNILFLRTTHSVARDALCPLLPNLGVLLKYLHLEVSMVCMGCIVAVFAQTVADGKILLQIWKSIKSIEAKLFSLGLNSSQQPKSWPKDHIHCLIQHNHPPTYPSKTF